MGLIAGCEVLQASWLQDKLEIQSALMQLRCMAIQLILMGFKLSDFVLPANLQVRALRPNESRRQLDTGEFDVYDRNTGDLFVQTPKSMWSDRHYIMTNCVYRPSINSSALHGAVACGWMMVTQFGRHHCVWNICKSAITKSPPRADLGSV